MGWRRFFRRGWWDDERARELDAHLQIETDEYIGRGLSPDDARAAAVRKLGNSGRIREEIYAMNTIGLLDSLWHDFRYAVRLFGRSPGFTAVAVLTLALGIGAVTIIYGVIRSILLDPFPYAKQHRMVDVVVVDSSNGRMRGGLSVPEFLDYRDQSTAFEAVVGKDDRAVVLTRRSGSVFLDAVDVTPNTFAALAVPPLLGRGLIDADARPGAPPVAVLSYGAWEAHFGFDPGVVNRSVVLDGTAYVVVGVMPPRFTWNVADVWLPLSLDPSTPRAKLPKIWLQAWLKPGATIQQAEAELNVIAARRAAAHPDEYPKRFSISVIGVIDWVVGRFRGILHVLFAAVGLLLVIACANVANMLLARATVRERELTMRAALGASRGRLVRQLLVESLLLALAGGATGSLLALAGIRGLALVLPRQNVPYEVQLRVDAPALAFCLATAVVTTLVFGLLPAWYAGRRDLVEGVKDGGRGSAAGGRHGWIRDGLVVGEIALSMVLLLGAGLLMRGFLTMLQVDLGFMPANLVIAAVNLPYDGRTGSENWGGSERVSTYVQAASERLRAVPGVLEVGAASETPLGGWTQQLERPGRDVRPTDRAELTFCDDAYLHVIGVPSIRGRWLSTTDVASANQVAVVNQALVDRYFGTENPVGQLIRLPGLATSSVQVAEPTFEIVGIVGNVRNEGLSSDPGPALYVPFRREPPSAADSAPGNTGRIRVVFLAVRTAGDPLRFIELTRRTLRAVDARAIVIEVETMDSRMARRYAQPRFLVIVLSAFGVTGLLLVAVGLYGLLAYVVSRRTAEIAVRVALGAQRPDILRSVLASGVRLLAVGAILGAVASLGTNRLLTNWIWQQSTFDPVMMAVTASVIACVGVAACLVPALRAARVEPMQALRHE
jgi:putative ABC transport system permease protein